MKKLYRKKFDKLFLGKSLDLKTINQGGVPLKITRITFFIRVAKVKLLTRFPKQKVKLRKFGKNYRFFSYNKHLNATSFDSNLKIALNQYL